MPQQLPHEAVTQGALDGAAHPRRVWADPVVSELPALQQLTLQTGPGIPGVIDPGLSLTSQLRSSIERSTGQSE